MLLDHQAGMIHELLPYMGLGLGGIFCNILFKLSKLQKKIVTFSFRYWFKNNTFGTLFSLVATPILVYVFYTMGQMNETQALMTGWGADTIMKELMGKKSDAPKDDKHLTNVD